MTKSITVKEFQQELGEGFNTPDDYLMVSAFLNFLVRAKVIKENGTKPMPAGQRGKPSKLFEIENSIELVFWEDAEATPEIPTQKDLDNVSGEITKVIESEQVAPEN